MISKEFVDKVFPAELNVQEIKLLLFIESRLDTSGKFDKSNEWILSQLKEMGQKVVERTLQIWLESLKRTQLITVFIVRRQHKRIIRLNYAKKRPQDLEYDEMSPKQKMFQNAFPQRKVNAEVPDTVDMPALIEKIKSSNLLMKMEFTSLQWYIDNYERIMSGEFRNRKEIVTNSTCAKSLSTTRNYTNEELNSDLKSADEIRI